ncbi:hypothetical protein ACFLXY_11045 [Chloroflexota bacterium]
MEEFLNFLKDLIQALGISVSESDIREESKVAGVFLDKLNRYLYQQDDTLNKEYISRFHKFWETEHPQILNITVDDKQCLRVAGVFELIYANPDKYLQYQIKPPINREGISDRDVANVRFFTAIQDFKINIHKGGRNPFKQFIENPEWFTASHVMRNPSIIDNFLRYLEAAGSQGDKRYKWMLAAAEFLIEEHQGDAYNICSTYNKDAFAIREALASRGYLGYSYKKADMFLRDMSDWGIWSYLESSKLDVASDVNTMRVALRSGVIKTRFPLLASYLDVYCYQYGLVDNKSSEAWRRTWELWDTLPDNHRPLAPANMDYLLYQSIGKTVCRPKPKCSICILNSVCPQESRHLNPPKSISQKGATGWDSGITTEGGGGGIMS